MKISEVLNEFNIVVFIPFGSFLYGTEINMEDLNKEEQKNSKKYLSDKDYKGIYLPNKLDMYTNKIKKSFRFDSKNDQNVKNTSDDIDCEVYSLQHFIELALRGDTEAMDMLHCPKEKIIKGSEVWDKIVENKHRFFTKNLKTLVDYARGQAAKYGVKGSRVSDAQNVMKFFEKFDKDSNNPKLKDVWDQLPEGEHIFKSYDERVGLHMYEVCNRKAQETACVCYVRDEIIKKFLGKYGKRARMAANNEGIDWKAISHAVRAGSQLKEIIMDGTITYPLEDREFIKKVKLGRYGYFCIANYLDDMLDQLEELNKNSSLPMKPYYEFWKNFTLRVVEEYVK